MCKRPTRSALVWLLTAVAAAAFPAAASASVTPSLTVTQTAGTTAGSSSAVTFDVKVNANPATDSVKDLSMSLPPGLLANENIAGGACLVSSKPTPACQIGSGTATLVTSPVSVPFTLDLVAPPKPSDLAGVAVVIASVPALTADVTLQTTPDVGLDISFSGIPASIPITELAFTLNNLRLPTSCPSPAANVTVTADGQLAADTPQTETAPLTVTGCSSLPYSPKLSASVIKDKNDSGAELIATVTQATGQSASKGIELGLPSSLSPNVEVAAGCVTGTPCKIGTVAATSPLVPNAALARGTVLLGGSLTAPTMSISFPAPFALTLTGSFNLLNNSVTLPSPDVPLTSLTFTITGPGGGKVFETSCAPSSLTGTFTPQDGNSAVSVSAPIALSGCAGKPTSSGSFSGLASGHPKLRVSVTHGSGAPNVASLSLGLSSGLSFNPRAIVTHKTCKGTGRKRKCTTTLVVRGLSVSSAVTGVGIEGGKLVITLKKAAGSVSATVAGPLLAESGALRRRASRHQVKTVTVTVRITDAAHVGTTEILVLKSR